MTRQILKIYVDDLRPEPAGWVLVRTNSDAIQLINSAPAGIDEIWVSLDHDITAVCACGKPMRCPNDKCGKRVSTVESFRAVAYYIAVVMGIQKMTEVVPSITRVFCHSGNPFAYEVYQQILGDLCRIRPFDPVWMEEEDEQT